MSFTRHEFLSRECEYTPGELVGFLTVTEQILLMTIPVKIVSGFSLTLIFFLIISGCSMVSIVPPPGTSVPSPPAAHFTANITQGRPPLTVQFTDQSASDGYYHICVGCHQRWRNRLYNKKPGPYLYRPGKLHGETDRDERIGD